MDDPDSIPTWRPPRKLAAHVPADDARPALALGGDPSQPAPGARAHLISTPALFALIAVVSFAVVHLSLSWFGAGLRQRWTTSPPALRSV